MCTLCVIDPINVFNGAHAAVAEAEAAEDRIRQAEMFAREEAEAAPVEANAAPDGDADAAPEANAPKIAAAEASAGTSLLVQGIETVERLDTGSFNADGDMIVNYYFMNTTDVISEFGFTVQPDVNWTAYEEGQISAALERIEDVVAIDFVEVFTLGDADMEFAAGEVGGTFGSDLSLGFAFFPGNVQIASAVTLNVDGVGWDREATNDDPEGDDGGLEQGGTGLLTVLHEVGHAMGFDHPFEGTDSLLFPGLVDADLDGVADDVFDDAGSFNLNQDAFTVMSQTHGFLDHPDLAVQQFNLTSARAGDMMAIDTAALQVMYGENATFASGDDSYAIEDVTGAQNFYDLIWDTGGTDEITYSGAADATIDLRAATLNVEVGGGGFANVVSDVRGGYFIGNDVVIENAVTSTGDDDITGNAADNVLDGGAGADTIDGGDGADTLKGGAGGDSLEGGDGLDTVSYEDAAQRVQADLANVVAGLNDAAGDVFSNIENMTGSRFNDNIRGDNGDNVVAGGNFSDRVFGRAGDDTLFGDNGADAIYGNAGADEMTGGAARDRFIYFNEAESGVGAGNRDVITDFSLADADRIEISRFDADLTVGFNQAFTFIADAAFSNTAGELRFDQSSGVSTIVQGDQNGDGVAEFEIELTGLINLTETNFLL